MKCILSLSIFFNYIGQLPSGQPRHGSEYNITINLGSRGGLICRVSDDFMSVLKDSVSEVFPVQK